MYLFTNNASTVLANSITTGDTTIVVNGGDGGKFPDPSGGDIFQCSMEDAAGNLEIVEVTSRTGDSLTVVRAREGTIAFAFSSGDMFELRMTSAVVGEFIQRAELDDDIAFGANITVVGNATADEFIGGGAGITDVDAATLGGVALAALARTGVAETFDDTLDVVGVLTAKANLVAEVGLDIGLNGGGNSVAQFWDDTNDVFRSLQWDDTASEFQVEDAAGVLQTLIHAGNIPDDTDAETLDGVPAADYMRKDIAQTMAGALNIDGLLTIASLVNAGDITWSVGGSKGWFKIGTLLIAFGRHNSNSSTVTMTYGVTFDDDPVVLLTQIENSSDSWGMHVQTIGVSSCSVFKRTTSDILFLAVGEAA